MSRSWWIVDGAPHSSAGVREIAGAQTRIVETTELELEAEIARGRTREPSSPWVRASDFDALQLGADEVGVYRHRRRCSAR